MRAALAIALFAAGVAACTAPLEGLGCPCASGYECDVAMNVCRVVGEGVPDASSYEPDAGPDAAPDAGLPDATSEPPDAAPDASGVQPDASDLPDSGSPVADAA
jgi:hypothetical protein